MTQQADPLAPPASADAGDQRVEENPYALVAVRYEIAGTCGAWQHAPHYIEAREQGDGSRRWFITNTGMDWHLVRTGFDTPAAALAAYNAAIDAIADDARSSGWRAF